MSIPANRFSSNETLCRIANKSAGDSSAVVSSGSGKRLSVNSQGLKDPNGKWAVQYDWNTGNYYLSVSGDQYASVDSTGYIIASSTQKLWDFVTADEDNPMVAYFKDLDSEKVWQYDAGTNTIKLATLVKGDAKQIWDVDLA